MFLLINLGLFCHTLLVLKLKNAEARIRFGFKEQSKLPTVAIVTVNSVFEPEPL